MLRRYFGDKAFYRKVLVLLIPMIIQQFITSFVSLLDNVMVGSLGEEAISSASIANTIINVYNLTIWGGLGGVGIFGAQFFGKGDMEGVKHTLRFKMLLMTVVTVLAIGVFMIFGERFIVAFLQGDSNGGDLQLALSGGVDYLTIMLWGLVPFGIVQVYAGTLRETGETIIPMLAGACAIVTNLFLNWVLIYGNLGAPALGVRGAAIATVVSRYVEFLVVVIYAHTHTGKFPWLKRAYQTLRVPADLAVRIAKTGSPLMINEVIWSLGMTFITKFYSSRGLNAVSALNIQGTAWNLFCVIMFAMGSAVCILVGQKLGAGLIEEAKDVDRKLIMLSEIIHILIGVGMIVAAPYIPRLYRVSDEVRDLTRKLLIIAGIALPIHSFVHVTYFTIRSGGRTVITFLFDGVYTWVVSVLLAFCLCTFTRLDIVTIYALVQFVDVLKLVIGLLMLKSGFWARNVVSR